MNQYGITIILMPLLSEEIEKELIKKFFKFLLLTETEL